MPLKDRASCPVHASGFCAVVALLPFRSRTSEASGLPSKASFAV